MAKDRNQKATDAVPESASSPQREEVIRQIVDYLNEDGAPPHLIELYRIQADALYCAWVTARAVVDRLVDDGQVQKDQYLERIAKFTELVYTKIHLGLPQKSQIMQPTGLLDLSNITQGG